MGSDVWVMIASIAAVLSAIAAISFGVIMARIAAASQVAAARSAVAAEESQRLGVRQLEATVAATRAATQPYVWADIRMRIDGSLLVLHLGNTGPTVATNVRVTFEPPLVEWVDPTDDYREVAADTQRKLETGLPSLPPGRELEWTLGMAWRVVPKDGTAPSIRIAVTADGPHGQVPPLEYVVDLEAIKHSSGRAYGLGLVERGLAKIADSIEKRG